jgi:hypothetical protein
MRPHRVCKFLDVVDRIEYFADGRERTMPLPFRISGREQPHNGTIYFARHAGRRTLAPHPTRVNRLLAWSRPWCAGHGQIDQLKTIDFAIGIAVMRMSCTTMWAEALKRS